MSEENIEIMNRGIDVILSAVKNILTHCRGDYKWKQLFVESGELLKTNEEFSRGFENDLFAIFSEENMKNLAKELKGKNVFKIEDMLHDKLSNLMHKYDFPLDQAERYIHFFIGSIINRIECSDLEKGIGIFLNDMKIYETEEFNKINEELKQLKKIIGNLDKGNRTVYISKEIDNRLKRETINPQIGLDFFSIDDDEFINDFHKVINNERIDIVGKAKEETIYCILNELSKMKVKKIVYVITDVSGWEKLEHKKIKDAILIPKFYSYSINVIPHNVNIFVWNEDEPCNTSNRLKLRRRTKNTLITKLEESGLDHHNAYELIEKTNGLYVPLKKKIYNGAIYESWDFNNNNMDIIITALLCGKWTESDGDKLIIEELSGVDYHTFNSDILSLTLGENPYIIKVDNRSEVIFQLANIDEAWDTLENKVSNELWTKFVELFHMVLIEEEPLFYESLEKNTILSPFISKSGWSKVLKQGMIRTLIMRACYFQNNEYQMNVNHIVKNVLDTIDTKEKWTCISQYFTDLCEAAPSEVINKLEIELKNPSGMIELFMANSGDILFGKNYYTHILWAIEQLLLQKKYAIRAINFLWQINELNIGYKISNSPKNILITTFCPWYNVSVLTVDEKIKNISNALEKFNNVWEIVYAELPSNSGSICSSLNIPKYRLTDDVPIIEANDTKKTYTEFLNICVDWAECLSERWVKIIDRLTNYDLDTIRNVLEKLVNEVRTMSDDNAVEVKNKLRRIIYRHRYFCNSNWTMPESCLLLFDNCLNKIKLNDPIYEYLYLFSKPYDFPLLHPDPYNDDYRSNYRENNLIKKENEIRKGLKKYKDECLNLKKLVELSCQVAESTIGTYVAKYYCDEEYNEEIIELLLAADTSGKIVFDYMAYLTKENNNTDIIEKVLKVVKKYNNNSLIVNLLKLSPLDRREQSLIALEDEDIKKEFWSTHRRCLIDMDRETCLWALSECIKYGSMSVYVEMLYDAKEIIPSIEIYNSLIQLKESIITGRKKGEVIQSYFLEEILYIMKNEYIDDDIKCIDIAHVEIIFRNILDWEHMYFTKHIIKKNPTVYAELISIIYKKDNSDDTIVDNDNSKLANSVYDLFCKAKFCPAEEQGIVDLNNLIKWIEDFKVVLENQGQKSLFGRMLGRLLAYSPVGKDNLMPSESVRAIIEDLNDQSLNDAYVISELNKRGVYSSSDGKSEKELSQKYQKNADGLRNEYPITATIFDRISDKYHLESISERKRAENDW